MLRPIAVALCMLCVAALAEAQAPGVYQPRQTALGALGQTGVLRNSSPSGYRTAARNGVGASTAQPAGKLKPFGYTMSSGPTVSPYLNLYRPDAERGAPNYYTFVRPVQEQADAQRLQQIQLQQLQRQVQQTSYTAPAASVAGGARYGETGHFYGGWRR